MKSYPSLTYLPLVLDRKPAPTMEGRDSFPGLNATNRAPREAILHRAYAIWEAEGYPDDRHLANWLDAETEVMGDGVR